MFDIPGKITIGICFTLSSVASKDDSFKLRYAADNSKDKDNPLNIDLTLHKQFDAFGDPQNAVRRALASAVDGHLVPKVVSYLDAAVVAKQGASCTYRGALAGCHDINCPVHGDCYPDDGVPSGAIQFERGDPKEVIKVEKAKAKAEKAKAKTEKAKVTLNEILGSLMTHVDQELIAALTEIAKSDAHAHVTEDLERLREHVRFVLGEVLGVEAVRSLL
jgi:uncharacterized Zn finger protein (UPF0148 family)